MRSRTRVDIIAQAVSDRVGTLEPYAQSEGSNERHDGLMTAYKSEQRSLPIGTVTTTTLDRLMVERGLDRVDRMKLDIEGGEFLALRGATKWLSSKRPWIIVEIDKDVCRVAGHSADEVLTLLYDHDYEVRVIGDSADKLVRSAADLSDWQNIIATPVRNPAHARPG